jgi:hypothetical protein
LQIRHTRVSQSRRRIELAKMSAGYAATPTTLVSFSNADGAYPIAGLIADANGKLFGTTAFGGVSGGGTVS